MKNKMSLLFLGALVISLSSCNWSGGGSTSEPNYDPEYMTPGLIIENGVVTSYEGTDTEVVIPSIHDGYNVTTIGDWAFYGCTSLTSIIIPNSITAINFNAFYYCPSLTAIDIPNSVTSIGEGAFFNCSSLTSINVDSNNTHYSSIDGILYDKDATTLICCPAGKVGEVDIPNTVTSIGDSVFFNCSSLTSINVDSNNTHYSSIDGILYDKDATTLICCPAGKVGEVDIPNTVTSIGDSAFYYCTSLTAIDIPNSVTSIGSYALRRCTSLTSVNIPDSVTSIGVGAFFNCTSLASIYIPDSVTSIGSTAFSYCSSLTIYCEAESQPSGWHTDWNPDNRPVIWGA